MDDSEQRAHIVELLIEPWWPGEGDAIIQSALDAIQRFQPELIVVSAGFDAYAHDPLAQGTLEAEDFHWIGKSLRSIGVPMLSLLEGGYSDDLPELIFAYLNGMNEK